MILNHRVIVFLISKIVFLMLLDFRPLNYIKLTPAFLQHLLPFHQLWQQDLLIILLFIPFIKRNSPLALSALFLLGVRFIHDNTVDYPSSVRVLALRRAVSV